LIKFFISKEEIEGRRSQNLILFIREYAISGDPSIKKFPNLSIINGKKIVFNL